MPTTAREESRINESLTDGESFPAKGLEDWEFRRIGDGKKARQQT